MATVAQATVQYLLDAGIDTFFGVPGGPIIPAFDAVLTLGGRLVDSRHETCAAFEAAGYWRSTSKTPCILLTAGPGMTNALTGIASAHLEGVPMVVLAGDVAWSPGGRHVQNSGPAGLDVDSIFRSVVRAFERASNQPSAVLGQVASVVAAAREPSSPGPAMLVLPINVALMDCSAAAPLYLRPWSGPTFINDHVVSQVRQRLQLAKRPLLVLGKGCRPFEGDLRQLLRSFEVPFVTTPAAKGLLGEGHPLSLRNAGFGASVWAQRYVAGGVDACLVLGTDVDDISVGTTPYVGPDGALMHVDRDPRVFGQNLPTAVPIVADVGDFISAFSRGITVDVPLSAAVRAQVDDVRSVSAFQDADFATDVSGPINPARAIHDLQQAFPAARFVSDIGEHMLFALHYLTVPDSDSFDIHFNLGSMGSGIATAIGLALGDPSRPVVCICGDGGMQMFGMELLVAVKERLNVVFAVFNDGRYNMVYHGHKNMFGHDAPWEVPTVNFVDWAYSLGANAMLVSGPGELAQLEYNHPYGGPLVVDIRIDRDKFLSGNSRNETLLRMSARI